MFFRFMVCFQSPVTLGFVLNLCWVFSHYFTSPDSDAGRDWEQEEKGTTGWDGWMESLTQWTWVWVNSGRWWWTGRPDMLRFMGSQRVGHDWATELNWTQCTTNGVCYLAKRLISDPLNFSGRKNSRTAWKDRWETTNIPSYSKVLIAIFNNECQNEKSLKSQI